LALAISLGACLNAGLLYYQLRRQQIFTPQAGWPVFLGKLVLALFLMALALWFAMGTEASWMESGLMVRIAKLTMLVVLGAAVYLGSLWLLGFRLRDFSKRAI
jgi:putative peptidoglycan lipid II flippase